jgi:hypothetical protein
MSHPNHEASATDGRKHGISVRLGKKCAALAGLLEGVDGVVIAIGAGYAGADTGEDESRGYGLKQFKHR